jgi:ATP-dependent metalloprotease
LDIKFILLVITTFYFRVMGAAALQKYIGSLGGMGASGVGSSSSYSAKDLNKDVTPEKV